MKEKEQREDVTGTNSSGLRAVTPGSRFVGSKGDFRRARTYDSAGRITQYTSLWDGTVTYTHDATAQLTGADYDTQTDESYTYDGIRGTQYLIPGPDARLHGGRQPTALRRHLLVRVRPGRQPHPPLRLDRRRLGRRSRRGRAEPDHRIRMGPPQPPGPRHGARERNRPGHAGRRAHLRLPQPLGRPVGGFRRRGLSRLRRHLLRV